MADVASLSRTTTGGSVPVPDPTVLTTQQLSREILALREILEARLEGLTTLIEQFQGQRSQLISTLNDKILQVQQLHEERFRSIEVQFRERDARTEQTTRDNKVAIDAALQAAKEAAAAIDEKTAHLQALHDEKFRSIGTQFIERDVRTEQTSRDSKVAVDAALQAAKEAVGEQNRSSALAISKSEAATAKQIDAQGTLISTATAALNDKIDDLKQRLTTIEGKATGVTTANTVSQSSQIQWVGIMGLVLGAVVGLGGIVMAITSRETPTPVVERVIVTPPGADAGAGNGLR